MKRKAIRFVAASALSLVILPGVARADLTWEHRLSVRLGSSPSAAPIGAITLRTQWQGTADDPNTAARMKLLVRASAKDFEKLPPLPFGPFRRSTGGDDVINTFAPGLLPGLPGGLPLRALLPEAPLVSVAGQALAQAARAQAGGKGKTSRKAAEPIDVGLVADLAGDKFLTYVSSQRTTLGGPLRPTLKRVRFDPWRKLAPRLSEEAPPELTRAQRERLGAEVRAVYRPFLKNQLKLYFRPLDEARTINGQAVRGYKLSILTNVGGQGGEYGTPPAWAATRVEMWLAPEQEGDALIRSFNRQARALRSEVGGGSASMWLNETQPVLVQMLPQEILQALEVLSPPEGASNEGFGGTPVMVHLTFAPPPIERMAIGETRVDLSLTSRSTAPIEASAFAAPAGYKAEPLEPILKKYEKSIKELDDAFEKATPGYKAPAKPKAAVKPKAAAKPAAKPKPKAGPPAEDASAEA